MDGSKRREKITEILLSRKEAVSGSELAKLLGVSRQVIVQDIALLRAVNKNILATTKGYLLYVQEQKKATRCFLVKHTTDQIEDELCTIIDLGGKVLDVIVIHQVYGQIQTDLVLQSRADIAVFMKKANARKSAPLNVLTDGTHLHTVEADSEEILDQIEASLRAKNYLINE